MGIRILCDRDRGMLRPCHSWPPRVVLMGDRPITSPSIYPSATSSSGAPTTSSTTRERGTASGIIHSSMRPSPGHRIRIFWTTRMPTTESPPSARKTISTELACPHLKANQTTRSTRYSSKPSRKMGHQRPERAINPTRKYKYWSFTHKSRLFRTATMSSGAHGAKTSGRR